MYDHIEEISGRASGVKKTRPPPKSKEQIRLEQH